MYSWPFLPWKAFPAISHLSNDIISHLLSVVRVTLFIWYSGIHFVQRGQFSERTMLCRGWWGSCREKKFQSDESLGQPVCSHVFDAVHSSVPRQKSTMRDIKCRVMSRLFLFSWWFLLSATANTQGLKKTEEQMPWVTIIAFFFVQFQGWKGWDIEQCAEAAFIGKTTAGWRCWSLARGLSSPVETDAAGLCRKWRDWFLAQTGAIYLLRPPQAFRFLALQQADRWQIHLGRNTVLLVFGIWRHMFALPKVGGQPSYLAWLEKAEKSWRKSEEEA